jgi:hypothetical protein
MIRPSNGFRNADVRILPPQPAKCRDDDVALAREGGDAESLLPVQQFRQLTMLTAARRASLHALSFYKGVSNFIQTVVGVLNSRCGQNAACPGVTRVAAIYGPTIRAHCVFLHACNERVRSYVRVVDLLTFNNEVLK